MSIRLRTIQGDDQTLLFHARSDRLLCVTDARDSQYLSFCVSRSLVKLSPSQCVHYTNFQVLQMLRNVGSRRRHEAGNVFLPSRSHRPSIFNSKSIDTYRITTRRVADFNEKHFYPGPPCLGPFLRRTAQNFTLFFPSSASIFALFVALSLGVFSWNFAGV